MGTSALFKIDRGKTQSTITGGEYVHLYRGAVLGYVECNAGKWRYVRDMGRYNRWAGISPSREEAETTMILRIVEGGEFVSPTTFKWEQREHELWLCEHAESGHFLRRGIVLPTGMGTYSWAARPNIVDQHELSGGICETIEEAKAMVIATVRMS